MRRVGDASYSIASRKILDQRVANLERWCDCKGKGLPNGLVTGPLTQDYSFAAVTASTKGLVGLLWQIAPSGYCGGWSSNACPQVIGEVIRLLTGDWRVGGQDTVLAQPNGGIIYRFHARDLHLVLGPAPDGKPVKFQVLIDGACPGR